MSLLPWQADRLFIPHLGCLVWNLTHQWTFGSLADARRTVPGARHPVGGGGAAVGAAAVRFITPTTRS